MIAFCSWTGTKLNLSTLQAGGWHLLMSPDTLKRCKGKTRPFWPDGSPAPYALDNGAWGAHQRGEPFNIEAFLWSIDRVGDQAEFVVIPDIVAGGLESLRFSEEWMPRLDGIGDRRLLAVQDGMAPADVRSMLGKDIGIFLGGSTDWKLSTMRQWGQVAREIGCWFHVGRVNSRRRIYQCSLCGAHSFDGSKGARNAVNIEHLTNSRNQLTLLEIL